MNRRDSIKLFAAVGGGVLLGAGDILAAGREANRAAMPGSLYAVQPAFTPLKFGEIRPAGWILAQMRRDLQTGFAGRLDELCHEASSDIFVAGRNRPGKTNNGNAANDSWWNGETEGNWRCGQIMQACLTQDPAAMAKANAYVEHIVATQDKDGYIGIFSPELRYSGNGEFWTQTCLFRGLLAYADATGNGAVFAAIRRAVDRTMEGYGAGKGFHFSQHDALYCDVLEALYARTGEKKYLDFALRIYHERENLLAMQRQPLVGSAFQRCYMDGHGPSVAESARMPFWFWTATGDPEYLRLGMGLIAAMNTFKLPSGAMVSEESIDAPPHPSGAGYEYCALFELQYSLLNAGQKKGDAAFFQAAEHLWFNAAQGSREPDGSAILYCSYENRLSVHDEIGKRQRFSPTHQQVAVCCAPNSTRVAPYFVAHAWMRPAGAGSGSEPALAATLYGPCEVKTQVAGVAIRIEERTNYPYAGDIEIVLRPEKPVPFCLWLRDPEWSKETNIVCPGASLRKRGPFFEVRKVWRDGDRVTLRFDQKVRAVPALDNEFALQYGPLLYVLPVEGQAETVKTYDVPGFKDYYVTRTEKAETDVALAAGKRDDGFGFTPQPVRGTNPDYPLDGPGVVLSGELLGKDGKPAAVSLEPMGARNTRLRRVTFPVRG